MMYSQASNQEDNLSKENVNKILFNQLIPVFQNPGMKLNIEKILEWLDYNFENDSDITYEEYLGSSTSNDTANGLGILTNIVEKVIGKTLRSQ